MTKEEIIEMAKQAGMIPLEGAVNALGKSVPLEWLMDFAKLVVEKEREECAEAVEGYRKQRTHETWYKAEEQIRARGQE